MGSVNFDAESKDIIGAIQDGVDTKTIEVPKGHHVTREVFLPPKPALAAVIQLASLTGLVDHINSEVDINALSGCFIQVKSPTEVEFQNDIAEQEDRRFSLVSVRADAPSIRLNDYLPQEQAMIQIQALFVDSDAKEDLLRKIGTIAATEELQHEDDGVTQRIVTQSGIKRAEESIENPVYLAPFRTFTEVEQPESPFIVRLKRNGDSLSVGLFEADGGQWRNKARRSIAAYLKAEVKKDYPVIA